MANICKLIIDNRENIKLDIKNKVNDAIFENLDLGDFLFKVNDVDVLIIERKTISDYAASIKDGRNREQKKRLLLNYPLNKILYLIEGDLTTNNPNFGYNQVSKETIVSSIINTVVRDNIHVFHTSSINETIEFLSMVYIKFSKNGMDFINNTTTHSQDLVNSAKLSKKDHVNPSIGFQMMLNCIPSISNKLSERLSTHFINMNELIVRLQSLPDNGAKESYIINIKTDDTLKGKKISKTVAKNIIEYLGIGL